MLKYGKFSKYIVSKRAAHPIYLIHFVTSKCMARCSHCFYHESLGQPEEHLTLEEIDRMTQSMKGGLLQLLLTGGEPFIRKDMTEIMEIYYRNMNPVNIGVATSGFYTDRVVDSLSTLMPKYPDTHFIIGLPIEGDRAMNDEIRGIDGFFDKTVATLKALQDIRETFRQNRTPAAELSLLVDITACKKNQDILKETYEYIRDVLKPDAINILLSRGDTPDADATDVDIAKYSVVDEMLGQDQLDRKVGSYKLFGDLVAAKDRVLRRRVADTYSDGKYRYPCQAGTLQGVMYPEGDIYACELLNKPLGNVRDYDYDVPALWASRTAEDVRGYIHDTRCRCYHQCFLSTNIFFNPKGFTEVGREYMRMLAKRTTGGTTPNIAIPA